MHPRIAEKKDELIALCRRYDDSRLDVFGSAASGAGFDPLRSDADFVVEFRSESRLSPLDQFFGLADAMEKALGRPVDLVELQAIANPFLRAGIERSHERVYGP